MTLLYFLAAIAVFLVGRRGLKTWDSGPARIGMWIIYLIGIWALFSLTLYHLAIVTIMLFASVFVGFAWSLAYIHLPTPRLRAATQTLGHVLANVWLWSSAKPMKPITEPLPTPATPRSAIAPPHIPDFDAPVDWPETRRYETPGEPSPLADVVQENDVHPVIRAQQERNRTNRIQP